MNKLDRAIEALRSSLKCAAYNEDFRGATSLARACVVLDQLTKKGWKPLYDWHNKVLNIAIAKADLSGSIVENTEGRLSQAVMAFCDSEKFKKWQQGFKELQKEKK